MALNIEKQIRQGLPVVGVAPFRQIHAHSTGNARSTAQNEADYHSRRPVESGFFSHVVGNGRIIQTGPVGQGAYDVGGGWNCEGYAQVELIESHASKEEFMTDYKLYVNLLRQLAHEAGLPTSLDSEFDSDGTAMGIISHAYCTAHQPNNYSDHVDPYPYLAKWGISKEQFAHDLAAGFDGNKAEESKNKKELDMFTVNAPDRGIALMQGGHFLAFQKPNDPVGFWNKGIPHVDVSKETFDNWQKNSGAGAYDDDMVAAMQAILKEVKK